MTTSPDGAESAYVGGPDDHEDADGWYDRANDLQEAGHLDAALDAFRRAAALGEPDALLGVGNVLYAMDRDAEAADAFRAAEAGGNTAAVLNLGMALEAVGDYAGAEQAYLRARDVGDARAVMYLGHMLRRHADPERAQQLLGEAAADGDAYAAAELGQWLWQDAGQDVAALGVGSPVEALLAQAADVDEDARSDLAWIRRGRGDLDVAEGLLRAGVKQGHLDSAIKLAVLLEEDRADLAGAEQVLRSAAAGGELFAWNNLGLVLRDQGRLLEAEAALRRGASGGDGKAVSNLRALRRRFRRQLGRAHRRNARLQVAAGGT